MAVSTRIIKRRIRSIANTRKITKAMELVAAAKMRKSVQLTQASRAYSKTTSHIVADIRKRIDPNTHPLLAGRSTSRSTLLIIASSDRGLCGGFNSQILKKAVEFLRSRPEALRVITVGRRAESSMRREGISIMASFDAISNAPSFERTLPVGSLVYDEFTNGRADRVFLAFTDFRSAITQLPTVMQLLPIIPEGELSRLHDEVRIEQETLESNLLFEPDARQVLDTLLPRLIETQIYQSLLESSASEHSARMLAMRSATDNASGMLEDLTFTFNQARQANITREISEISAGKAAIE